MAGSAVGSNRERSRRVRVDTYLFFLAAFAVMVFVTHVPYLDLPAYWDELGQFLPASLDLYQHGLWVPRSAVPNVHPPGLMAYLAGVWHITGYSIEATRLAMLALASLLAFVTFLLTIRLARKVEGAPAFSAVLLLVISPLFFTQAMLAQLDMPAALFTVLALLLFLEERHAAAALASIALVLTKETGIVVPAVLGCWLLAERRWKRAALYLLPALALAAWLAVLWRATGHVFGNAEFEQFNLTFPLHPVRLSIALARRVFYLFFESFHWIGWVAVWLACRRTSVFRSRSWRVAGVVALVHVITVSVLGGATLERYLLPVLPLMYAAFAVSWSSLRSFWSGPPRFALYAGMLICLVFNPPYPYPFENNLAIVDFVRLQQTAAEFLEQGYAGHTVSTCWPLSAALRRPALGYVRERMQVKPIAGFRGRDLAGLNPASVDVFVLYSREWERTWDLRRVPGVSGVMRRLYGYEPQVTPEQLERQFHMTTVAHWSRGGQWIAVLERRAGR